MVALCICHCIGLAASPARADEIDRYIAQEQRVYGVPAVVVGLYRDGELVDQRAAGLVNVELGVAAEAKHVFEIGSISKQFTAWAILLLVEEDRLALDAPVGRYLAELPEAWAAPTLHQLLTHTSGLPDLEDAFSYGVYRETPGDADFLRRLVALPIDFKPGDQWAYSNTNYWLLARVVETISGRSYADFMQQRIFAPLGMASTRSALPARLLANRAAGYRREGDRLENRDAIEPHTGRGLGDLVTTVGDTAQWEREQLSPRLISAASAERARRPVVLNDGKTEPYGYGWETSPILGNAALHHTGQTAGFTSLYVRLPDRRSALLVLTNQYGAPVESIGEHLAATADPSLMRPTPQPVAETDPGLAARIRRLLDSAASADTEWQEAWFTAERWKTIRGSLSEVAAFYRRLGPVIGMTRVSRDDEGDARTVAYRIVHASVSRILTVGVDEAGRIARTVDRDE